MLFVKKIICFTLVFFSICVAENRIIQFKGKIDKYDIAMQLILTDSLVNGNYYYEKNGIPIEVSGRIDKNDCITIQEYDKIAGNFNEFSGKLDSKSCFEGTWIGNKNKAKLKFSLIEISEGLPKIEVENFYRENRRFIEINKHKNSDEIRFFDTLPIAVSLQMLKLNTGNRLIDEKINKSLIAKLKTISRFGETINSFLASVDSVQEGDYSSIETSYSPFYVSKDIICVQVYNFENFGGAHPNHAAYYYNYNLKTGDEIKIEDLFAADFKGKLNSIAEKLFYKENGKTGWEFENNKFALNNNFAISAKGLLFTYNPYEIAAYAAGSPTVFIPFDKIKKILKQ